MPSGSGGGGGGSGEAVLRFYPGVEESFNTMMNQAWGLYSGARIAGGGGAQQTPYSNYLDYFIDPDAIFFSSAFTKDMLTPIAKVFSDSVVNININDEYWGYENAFMVDIDNLVAAESQRRQDDLERNVIPKIQAGYLDANAIMSESYLIVKRNLYADLARDMTIFKEDLITKAKAEARAMWEMDMKWLQNKPDQYIKMYQIYQQLKADYVEKVTAIDKADRLWILDILRDSMRPLTMTLAGASATDHKKTLFDTIGQGIGMAGQTMNAAASVAALLAL